jgi:hypothetical protein
MANAKLDIWLRDEKCRPYPILASSFEAHDYVIVKNCMGENVTPKIPIPEKSAHVEVEVPPGCYIIEGNVCENDARGYRNGDTDRAIVIVGCGQVECVNLFVPPIIHCVRRDMNAILMAARGRVPDRYLQIAARTMIEAANIQEQEIITELEAKAASIEGKKELTDIRAVLTKNIDVLRSLPEIEKIKK